MKRKNKYGNRIKSIRAQLGLDQPDFAKIIGVTTVTISKWERGITVPSVDRWDRILSLLEPDYQKYELLKSEIKKLGLPYDEYEKHIQRIAKECGV